MRRFLLALVFFGAAIVLLRRLAGLFRSTGMATGSGRARERHNGATELVRDRVCNTFLPKSKALELTAAGETHFFCSKECRSTFLAGPVPSDNIARRA